MIFTKNARLAPAVFALVISTFAASVSAQEDNIEQEFDVGRGGMLTLKSDAGAISVSSWDQNRVRVRVRNAENFDVQLEQSGNNVNVLAERERSGGIFGWGGSNISFDVDVPEEYSVDLDTGGGMIEVGPLIGDVTADTSGGRIEIGAVTGDVRADTSGGRIDIDDVDGDVIADTSGGAIEIGNVTGDVTADTSGGNIRIGDVGGEMEADTSGGSITVGQGSGPVNLNTSGGTIRADYALGPIVADTSGGNIILEGSEVSVEADTSGGNIEIARSNGAVTADTSGGSITIRQAVGPIRADTAGGRIDAELIAYSGTRDASVELETAGGDVTIRVPSDHSASIVADLQVSRRSRGDYRIYTDFPLTIQEDDDGDIVGRGDINGGGDRIYLETNNSDIHIVSVED